MEFDLELLLTAFFVKVTNIFGLLCEYHSPYVNVAALFQMKSKIVMWRKTLSKLFNKLPP